MFNWSPSFVVHFFLRWQNIPTKRLCVYVWKLSIAIGIIFTRKAWRCKSQILGSTLSYNQFSHSKKKLFHWPILKKCSFVYHFARYNKNEQNFRLLLDCLFEHVSNSQRAHMWRNYFEIGIYVPASTLFKKVYNAFKIIL